MPRNSGGTYTLPAGNPVVTGTVISSVWANTTLSDIATALTDSVSRSGQGAMTGPLLLSDGTSGAPGLSWGTETTSGLYRFGVGDFRYVIAGSDRFQITTTGIRTVDGVVGTPAFSFLSDTDTGIFRVGANDFAFVTNGISRLDISATALTGTLQWLGQDGTVALPGLSFSADPDTGIYRIGANQLGISSNGVNRMQIDTSGVYARINLYSVDGLVGTPGISFENDPDTGFYRVIANRINVALGGLDSVVFYSGGIQLNQAGMAFYTQDGSAGSPSLSFANDSDTGFYRDTNNQIAISLGGVTAGQIVQGTFTGTLSGASGATGTINYQRIGNMARLWAVNPITGASSSTAFSITGLPAIVSPANQYLTEVNINYQDNSAIAAAQAVVLTGTVTFLKLSAFNAASSSGWTAAGTKGIGTGWTISYPVA